MTDNIDAAIAANGAAQPVQLQRIGPITLATSGRPFFLDVPVGLQPIEIADIITWLGSQLIGALRQAEAPRGPSIALPDGRMVRVKPS